MITLPTTYAEWRHCITVTCTIVLTEVYFHQRLRALRAPADRTIARFRALQEAVT